MRLRHDSSNITDIIFKSINSTTNNIMHSNQIRIFQPANCLEVSFLEGTFLHLGGLKPRYLLRSGPPMPNVGELGRVGDHADLKQHQTQTPSQKQPWSSTLGYYQAHLKKLEMSPGFRYFLLLPVPSKSWGVFGRAKRVWWFPTSTVFLRGFFMVSTR